MKASPILRYSLVAVVAILIGGACAYRYMLVALDSERAYSMKVTGQVNDLQAPLNSLKAPTQ
ncbi:MAG: hypothetical protein V4671_07905 [Armatimonadota bacterium]